MAETLKFELVSPERLLLSEPVEMVVVPGADGYFGVLPKHAPVMSTLRPGVIDVYRNGSIAQQYFVDGGFAEVNAAGVTVLVDEAVPVAEITKAKVDERREAAQTRLERAASEDEKRKATQALRVAEEMAAVASRGN
ncbi:MAG: F0F1 ATP synthase subunit epsilon [Rhodospirillaceae bacterium]|nr:F0F1 ATP synthase subunit epsilon [Rhodospirillaceae bacterium]